MVLFLIFIKIGTFDINQILQILRHGGWYFCFLWILKKSIKLCKFKIERKQQYITNFDITIIFKNAYIWLVLGMLKKCWDEIGYILDVNNYLANYYRLARPRKIQTHYNDKWVRLFPYYHQINTSPSHCNQFGFYFCATPRYKDKKVTTTKRRPSDLLAKNELPLSGPQQQYNL